MIMLCFFLSASLISCQKEAAPADTTNLTSDIQDYPGPEDTIEPSDSAFNDNTGSLAMTSTTFGTRKNLYFNFTTEPTNALSSFAVSSNLLWKYKAGWTSTSIQRSSAFARTGTYSAKYTLNKTDGDVGGSKRTETNRSQYDEPVLKMERWYAASYYLPNEYVSDKAPEILMQWHTDKGSPPLALWTMTGQWRIVKFGNQSTTIGNYERNKWTDFVFHVKWSTGTDGLIEVWKDGVKVYTKAGATNYADATLIYMKAGIYKWPWKTGSYGSTTTQRVVYIDDVRIGNAAATYYDVAPGAY